MNASTLNQLVYVNILITVLLLVLFLVSMFEMDKHHKQIESLELKHEVVVE